MIVGFPGETAEEFDETLSLTAAVRYHSMFSFKYSERPNTLAAQAARRTTVPEAEKTRRIVALQQLQREIQLELHEAMVGETFDVLVDAASRRRALGAVGPHERQHGREPARRGGLDWADRACHNSACGPQQRLGRGSAVVGPNFSRTAQS